MPRSVVAVRNRARSPKGDGRVDRLGTVVEQVERPDIKCPTRKIETSGCRRFNLHAGIIMCPALLQTPRDHSFMSRYVRRRVGQLIMAGFTGPTIPDDLRLMAREFDLGGIILFDRNVEAPQQVAELAYDAQQLSSELPLWVSVDQEGGRVARLREPFTVWPPMQTLGRSGEAVLTRRFAEALAAELRTVGISLDFVPVLDVHTNPDNPVIGDRALSDDADTVARLAGEMISALQASGVAACGKHFPGHGDTSVDSHHELPVVDHGPERLDEVELVPFKAAIARDVAMIMTAHVLYPALDPRAPATISSRIVSGLLREELGFGGVVATDDMSMGGIADGRSIDVSSVEAIVAGCDMVLLCEPNVEQQIATLEALIRAVEADKGSLARVEDALTRGRQVKERFLTETPDWRPPSPESLERLGCDEHAAVAATMQRYA